MLDRPALGARAGEREVEHGGDVPSMFGLRDQEHQVAVSPFDNLMVELGRKAGVCGCVGDR